MKLSFYGGVEEVTGSCFLLETNKAKILVDCGMKQGERICVARSLESFGFEPKSLDAVFITHAHFDHTGRLPELVRNGYKGPIYLTAPTKALASLILDDSLHIMKDNAKRCSDPMPYELADKEHAQQQMQGVNYHTELEVAPGVRVMFHDAGHILGSSFVTVEVDEVKNSQGQPFRLIFSGDLGNDRIPILPPTEAISRADAVVCEATYGDRLHDPADTRKKKLAEFVKRIISRKGTLLIPAFSIERTQEILYELDTLLLDRQIPSVPIYLDSPLAIRATEVYRHFKQYLKFDHPILGPDKDFFSFPSLRETLTSDESKLINDDHLPKIIIAGNGMMTGGRILHHLKRHISDSLSGLLVVGYQAKGTLGRKVLNREAKISIHREEYSVRAEVLEIEAFSAHADKDKLTRWLHPEEGSIDKIFLVHGDESAKQSFANHLTRNLPAEIIIPRQNQEFDLSQPAKVKKFMAAEAVGTKSVMNKI